MLYNKDEIIKDLNNFKLDALIRLNILEERINNLTTEDKQLQTDINDLKTLVRTTSDDLNTKVDYIKNELPSPTTNKIIFAIFGGAVSIIVGILLQFMG